MRVSLLRNRYRNKIAVIVGTGPSLRGYVKGIPLDLFFPACRVTIGLNQAWRHFDPDYSVTIHPELVTDEARTQWVVKGFKRQDIFGNPVPVFKYDDKKHYVFRTTKAFLETFQTDHLYQGGGVQTTAMHFAYVLGCTRIVLIGVDMCSLDDEFHGHAQHVRWNGVAPPDQYREYRDYARKMRTWLFERGVTVVSLSPFIGVGNAEEDFRELKLEHRIPNLPQPEDISGKR